MREIEELFYVYVNDSECSINNAYGTRLYDLMRRYSESIGTSDYDIVLFKKCLMSIKVKFLGFNFSKYKIRDQDYGDIIAKNNLILPERFKAKYVTNDASRAELKKACDELNADFQIAFDMYFHELELLKNGKKLIKL